MASYRLLIKKSAQKEIRKLPKDYRLKILSSIGKLKNTPLPQATEKLKGLDNVYRIRQGVYRVVYSVNTNELVVFVIKVSHRKDSYRKL